MRNFLDKLLEYYGLDINQYNEIKKDIDVSLLPDISFFTYGINVSNILSAHIRNNDKIAIYGDYDCDGIMATSILAYSFKKIGFNNYSYFIPTREENGYGVNIDFAKDCETKNIKLIICVDNGINANDVVDFCNSHGIDIIIADHHEINSDLINTKNIIHPFYSKEPEIICSGGFTSYILSTIILNDTNPYALSLAGISIISDMMSLTGYNKNIVKLSLKYINQYKFKPLMYLIDYKFVDENVISTTLAPKINSVGRLINDERINNVVNLFTTGNSDEIVEMCDRINSINQERKDLVYSSSCDISEFKDDNCIVLALPVKEGLVGLFANKLLQNENKLCVVFSSQVHDGIMKGSARSKNGISLVNLFKYCADLLVNSGGHCLAGGLAIKESNFEAFKERVISYTKEKEFISIEKKVIKISPIEITYDNYETLRTFGPFGVGNIQPTFIVKDFPIRSFNFSKDGKHIITRITNDGKIVCFNYNKNAIIDKAIIDMEGTFSLNEYKGFFSTNFIVNKLG